MQAVNQSEVEDTFQLASDWIKSARKNVKLKVATLLDSFLWRVLLGVVCRVIVTTLYALLSSMNLQYSLHLWERLSRNALAEVNSEYYPFIKVAQKLFSLTNERKSLFSGKIKNKGSLKKIELR